MVHSKNFNMSARKTALFKETSSNMYYDTNMISTEQSICEHPAH